MRPGSPVTALKDCYTYQSIASSVFRFNNSTFDGFHRCFNQSAKANLTRVFHFLFIGPFVGSHIRGRILGAKHSGRALLASPAGFSDINQSLLPIIHPRRSCEREGFTALAAALAEMLKRELSTRKSHE